MAFVSVEQAIKDLRSGKMLVMVDAEDRENEGDIIFAAQFSDKEKVNFTITHARGVLCVALSEKIARHFSLPLMVAKNTSSHATAFTITVDAKGVSTGVSATERDITIRLFADSSAKASDFMRPGHINPLIAKKGGVLERTGHTEGSVDLCRLAGLKEACVICEIVKDDGDMARRVDLISFCKKFNLNMIAVSDLIEYRLKNESLIKLKSERECVIAGFKARRLGFEDHEGLRHIVFCFGEIKNSANVKFHASGSDFELLTSNKFNELLRQIKFLSQNGGVLVFLQGEKNLGERSVRKNSAKISDKNSNKNQKMSEKNSGASFREFGIGAQILGFLGIEEVRLLSKSQAREFIGLEGFGLKLI